MSDIANGVVGALSIRVDGLKAEKWDIKIEDGYSYTTCVLVSLSCGGRGLWKEDLPIKSQAKNTTVCFYP